MVCFLWGCMRAQRDKQQDDRGGAKAPGNPVPPCKRAYLHTMYLSYLEENR
jgi:hypothetical protein